jgi:hypothetical protein
MWTLKEEGRESIETNYLARYVQNTEVQEEECVVNNQSQKELKGRE